MPGLLEPERHAREMRLEARGQAAARRLVLDLLQVDLRVLRHGGERLAARRVAAAPTWAGARPRAPPAAAGSAACHRPPVGGGCAG